MLKKLFWAAAALCMLLTACGGNTAEVKTADAVSKTAVTFTDDMGRSVTVDRPQRVACLTGSFADIWRLAGGEEQIIAVTDAALRYFDLTLRDDAVNLGASKTLDLEKLLACEPDFILASCGTDRNVELEATFEKMGLNAAYFSVNSLDDYLRMLKICTDITGCEQNYQAYGVEVKKQVEKALERVDGSNPKVLYIRATGSSFKVKNSQNSVLGEMLADLGCGNIADRDNSLLEQLSMETIIDEDPDFIFIVLQSADPADAQRVLDNTLLNNPAWAELEAVKNERCHVMDPNLYNMKPNGRWGEAYEKLADILYPAG